MIGQNACQSLDQHPASHSIGAGNASSLLNTSNAIDMTEFNTLTISQVSPQPGGITLGFTVPKNCAPDYRFIPGQYLTLRSTIDNKEVRRSYSICSGHQHRQLVVAIKKVPNGLFSNYATTLVPGDQLEAMIPQGSFTAQIGGIHNYLLIAAGSGITPCLSIATSVLQSEPESHITLLYGNRYCRSIMFRKALDDLKDQYKDRFMLVHILSGEQQDVALLNGRIDASKLKRFNESGLIDVKTFSAAYLCGPKAMIDNCVQTLTELGLKKDKIKFELFYTGDEPVIAQKPAPEHTRAHGVPVTIIHDGSKRIVQVNNETILAAAKKAGLDLPYSCAGGMCCTCRCKVISGNTAMDVNFSLADWEIDEGFTLACQTRPYSNNVVLDFDAS